MRALLDLLVPSCCDGCGARAQPPWCRACDRQARANRPDDPCPGCAGADVPGHACWTGGVVASTVALTAWRDPVARALVQAKLAGRAEVFTALGPGLAALVEAPVEAVVAVPTDPRRMRERGSDHAAALGRAVAGSLRVPYVPALRVGRRVPDRGSATSAHRGELPPDTFLVTRQVQAWRDALLVDDVLTTGGTAALAARVLRAAGVRDVHVAVVARAGQHPLAG